MTSRHITAGWGRDRADDIDEAAVLRLMRSDPPATYTCWERREAVRRLRQAGHTYGDIAVTLDLDEQQIWRDLTRAGMTQPLNDNRLRDVSARRRVIPALVAAGAGRAELARLLDADPRVITRDLHRLGLRTGPRNRYTSRGRAELLATYGHLLHQPEGATA